MKLLLSGVVFVVAAFLVACPAAAHERIDCDKAQQLSPGIRFAEVKRALGKPPTMKVTGGIISYLWGSPHTGDSIEVTLIPSSKGPDSKDRVLKISGNCHGSPFGVTYFSEAILGDMPRRIDGGWAEFHLAYLADNLEEQIRFAEYVPEGQTLSGWKQMISAYLHLDGRTMEQQLQIVRSFMTPQTREYYREIPLSSDGTDMVATQLHQQLDHVEYLVSRWQTTPQGLLASNYAARWYGRQPEGRSAFAVQQTARLDDIVAMLQALPQVMPPPLNGTGALWLTQDGTDDSPVRVQRD